MEKITLGNILSGFNLNKINDNFTKIQDVINNKLLANTGDTLQGDLDVNGKTLYNLPAPYADSHPARLKDVNNAIAGLAGQTANLISFAPTPDILATNIQGAIQELSDKKKGTISLTDFKIGANTGNAVGGAIQNALSVCTALGITLNIPGGEYLFSAGTSLDIDPSKTRIVGLGAATFRWTASPSAGYAVRIVGSENSPYETVRKMVGRVLDGIAIVGSQDSSNLFSGTGLRVGNGVNHTNSLSISHVTVSGFSNVLDITDNTWWLTFEKCRFLWGTITSPTASGNWGESYTFYDCQFLDGVVFKINYGEWRLYGGSCDNSQLKVYNHADVAWFGAHFENPGQSIIPLPYVDIQGTEACVHLVAPHLITNSDGSTPITVAPFNVISTNTLNGLILDGLQFTQGGVNKFYSLVSGGGRVRATRPKILGFANFNFTVLALTMRGQLSNYGFETGNLDGWTVSASGTGAGATATNSQAQNESYSCLLTSTGDFNSFSEVSIRQAVAVTAGEFLQLKFGFKRDYSNMTSTGVVPAAMGAKIEWLDSTGAVVSNTSLIYNPASTPVVDSAWTPVAFNGFVPAGISAVRLYIYNQRNNATGVAKLYVDDVYLNLFN